MMDAALPFLYELTWRGHYYAVESNMMKQTDAQRSREQTIRSSHRTVVIVAAQVVV